MVEMLKLPFYEKPKHPFFALSPHVDIHMIEVVYFLKWIIDKEQLEISNYFEAIKDEPFFLVAATGLGKTVGVPLHVLIRQIQRTGNTDQHNPKVWIVEPRIPIAIDQTRYMNSLWFEYISKYSKNKLPKQPLFGCVSSSSGRINPDAPIQFITTGIFELLSRNRDLNSINDRVVIDEAHVTVEQNPGVELGIALAKSMGVTIDYMSATVDIGNIESCLGVTNIIRADQQRNIIWKSNLLKSLDQSIEDLVEKTLIKPDSTSIYFPKDDYKYAKRVICSALEPGRSHGMLVVVNSFSGETSDITKIADKLRIKFPSLPVLKLASEVVRDSKRESEFRHKLYMLEKNKQNYVILATSVVEMGITFPTLDYVVTMDSGYDQETIGDISFPVVVPLGVNSLLQRMGRVGRRRPGIAYITQEVGADYSVMEDSELNSGRLSYEPIKFPLATSPLTSLVYYAVKQEEQTVNKWLENLNLPSKIHLDKGRMEYFNEQLEKLKALGIIRHSRLTPLGEQMEQWFGRADLAYATQLQKRLYENASLDEMLFWIVATALSNVPLASLKSQYAYFVDYEQVHKNIANRLEIWGKPKSEDIALFQVFAKITQIAPSYVSNVKNRNGLNQYTFERWTNWCGIDGRKVSKLFEQTNEVLQLFSKINSESAEFKVLFGDLKQINFSTINWASASDNLNVNEILDQIVHLPGVTNVQLTYNPQISSYEWTDEVHGHTGIISQDDTPVKLLDKEFYSARIFPSRQAKDDELSWRLMSLVQLGNNKISKSNPKPINTTPNAKADVQAKKSKKSFWAWISS